MYFLFGIIAVPLQGGRAWYILVDTGFCGYNSIACVAGLDKIQVSAIDASMVAGMKDVVADICCVFCHIIEIRIGRITGEKACPISKLGTDDKAGIMKFPGIRLSYM